MYERLGKLAKQVWGSKVNDDELEEFVKVVEQKFAPLYKSMRERHRIDSYIEAFITSMDDMVFEMDSEARFINAWSRDEQTFWMPKEHFMGKTTKEVFDISLGEELHNTILEVQNDRQPREVEYKSPYANQYFIARINFIEDLDPQRRHVSILVHDITQKKKADQELLDAKIALEEALKAKSQFLSSVSHEIRTPMNAIIGLTDILLEQHHSEETLEYLHSIKYSSENLLVIINDILNYSKLEAGKIELENIPFRLDNQVNEWRRIFSMKAAEKNIDYAINLEDNLPLSLEGDPYRLNQILVNLIGNAIKFTEEGGVFVTIKLCGIENEKALIQFKIKDTGIGIPEDKFETVFESFAQASSATSRKFGGTGLGLAITKDLVNLMKGDISFESKEGEGTCFNVMIPFIISEKDIQPILKDELGTLSLFHLTILIVEDNLLNQMVIKKILDDWEVNYFIANNGKEALDILEKEKVDFVFMDLQMPVMDGFETTVVIRSKNTAVLDPDVPIIAFTADAFPETKIKVLEAGMNDYVTKPFKKEEIYTKIVKHLNT